MRTPRTTVQEQQKDLAYSSAQPFHRQQKGSASSPSLPVTILSESWTNTLCTGLLNLLNRVTSALSHPGHNGIKGREWLGKYTVPISSMFFKSVAVLIYLESILISCSLDRIRGKEVLREENILFQHLQEVHSSQQSLVPHLHSCYSHCTLATKPPICSQGA